MSTRKTAKGAKVDKAVHTELAAELDASKQEIVRLEEENKHLTKGAQGDSGVTKHEAKIAKMTTTTGATRSRLEEENKHLTKGAQGDSGVTKHANTNEYSPSKVELNSQRERNTVRDDANAAKEAAKQAKRSAWKVPVNNASAIHPSTLSALASHSSSFPPGGLGTSVLRAQNG
jgi:hypothetical protein